MKRFLSTVLLLILVFASAVFGVYFGISYMSGNSNSQSDELVMAQPQVSSTISNQIVISSSDISTTITEVVELVEPAVVTVVGEAPGQLTFSGYTGDQEVSGSGFIITSDGFIITNNHVVEGTDNIYIILSDGTELNAQVVSTDSFADLAILKAEGSMPGVAILGDSDNLKPGETVIAIGSPLGDFRNSVTSGVVSALGRSLDTGSGYQMENLVQTDAAINSGNSGGPLVNLAGEVVGINTAVVRGSNSSASAEGLGFAIPSNTALLISEQIIEKGYFARPYLGVSIQRVIPSTANRYNLPVEWGAYVTDVSRNSPAGQGGIRRGDIIVRMGDQVFDEETQFVNALFSFQPGDVVEVEFVRGNANVILQIVLTEAIY